MDKEMDGGKAVYEADVMLDGKNWEIKVGEDGKMVSKKLDSEEDEKDEKKGEKEEKSEKGGEHHGWKDKDQEGEHHGKHEDKDEEDGDEHKAVRRLPGGIVVEVRIEDGRGGEGNEGGKKHHEKGEKDEEHHGKHHDQDEEDGDEEVKVAMGEVPAAVKGTLAKYAVGATMPAEVEKEDKEGKAKYEAHVKMDGKDYEVKIAGDGTLLSLKLHDEGEKGEKDEDKKKD